ncbi:MAG TPA: hypothetical protein VNA57_10915 [Acidimicrobiales bacterium]|nr:hypothetical protein [Acidimicrobiales bacterium]
MADWTLNRWLWLGRRLYAGAPNQAEMILGRPGQDADDAVRPDFERHYVA